MRELKVDIAEIQINGWHERKPSRNVCSHSDKIQVGWEHWKMVTGKASVSELLHAGALVLCHIHGANVLNVFHKLFDWYFYCHTGLTDEIRGV